MNSNGPGWHKSFTHIETSSSPHSQIFTSVSVCCSARCYPFTSVMGRMVVHTAPQYTPKNLSPIWRSIFAPLFCAVQPRSVTEIAQPQSFLCVNRSPIRYDFLGGAKTIRYRVNTSLAFRWRVRCGKAYAADNVNCTRANSLLKQKIILSPLKMDITLLKVNMWIFSPQYTVVDS